MTDIDDDFIGDLDTQLNGALEDDADVEDAQGEEPEVEEPKPAKKPKAKKKSKKPKAKPAAKKRSVTIIIAESADRSLNTDVFVGWQGKSFLLKRGVEVKVPWQVAEVLKQSQEGVMVRTGTREDGGAIMEMRYRPRYPFQVVG